jgi:hypothetical protein
VTFVVRVRGRGILSGKCVDNGGIKQKKKKEKKKSWASIQKGE